MSHDISPYSKHNLDTSSIENLAKDLAKRMNVNVVYGFLMYTELWQLQDVENRNGFNKLGEVFIGEAFPTYKLLQEDYFENEMHKIYGDELFSMKEFWHDPTGNPSQDQIENYKKDYKYPYYEFEPIDDKYDGGIGAMIYTNFLECDTQYFSGWNYLVRLIKEDMSLEELNEYRRDQMKYARLFGGDKVYYIDFQSDHLGGFDGDFQFFTHDEFEVDLKNLNQRYVESFSDLFLDPENLQRYKNRLDEKSEYPGLFIDDFRDLE